MTQLLPNWASSTSPTFVLGSRHSVTPISPWLWPPPWLVLYPPTKQEATPADQGMFSFPSAPWSPYGRRLGCEMAHPQCWPSGSGGLKRKQQSLYFQGWRKSQLPGNGGWGSIRDGGNVCLPFHPTWMDAALHFTSLLMRKQRAYTGTKAV